MTNEQLAAKIFELVGGAENILSVTNCMTRVRLQLAKKIPADEIKKLDGVHGTNYSENAWNNYINMRDYLNANDEKAMEYSRLKVQLAEEYSDDRIAYTEGKHELIEKILEEAREWGERE